MTFKSSIKRPVPDYDEWGIDSHWDCDQWVAHWGGLVDYAKKNGQLDPMGFADRAWASDWLQGLSRVTGGKGPIVFDKVPTKCRIFDPEFKKLVSSRPILYDAVYRGLSGVIAAPLNVAEKAILTGSRKADKILDKDPLDPLVIGGVAAFGLLALFVLAKGSK